jgi:hypothetical protein
MGAWNWPPCRRICRAIAPGQSTEIALTVTVRDPKRAIVKIVAVQGDTRMPVEIPLFPPAKPFPDFRIADGQSVRIYQHATEKVQLTLGDGNGDDLCVHSSSTVVVAVAIERTGDLDVTNKFACKPTLVEALAKYARGVRTGVPA